ncbi:hypothetical protein CONPUDRAFT_167590 [Coniophora puteana RWD-64-598 SS2]|uniref:Uncharacterized protein n=1 Tax=Coniophora puteana (strain RWD-64-598) TaxID=741705 RepID=A0A5M3MHU0_CONPW|nr:uncharacterized protein CONPUDRAFT_167590 [Coniophora puteana RWD-64-598 SS2]EIW78617.1 hypothetical protein CONPUDRAFT_167590 [Coniophora puteana RWD-64-598 SS2]
MFSALSRWRPSPSSASTISTFIPISGRNYDPRCPLYAFFAAGGVYLTMRPLILSITPTVPLDASPASSELELESHLLLPNLEELQIHHTRDFRPSENEVSRYTQLRECLRQRDAAGTRLRLLKVEEGTSNFHMNTEQNVEEMGRDRSVDEVVWIWPYKKEPVSA